MVLSVPIGRVKHLNITSLRIFLETNIYNVTQYRAHIHFRVDSMNGLILRLLDSGRT